jgi:hypothetical protein
VLDEYRRLELPYLTAMTLLQMCSTLDATLPEVAAVGEEARSIFEDLGSSAWLERLDEALSRSASAARSSPPARDAVPSRSRA